MSLRYCQLCQRPVEAKRHIGVGTLILVLFTCFLWIIAIPFYSKRCPICKSLELSKLPKSPKMTAHNSIICSCGHANRKDSTFCEECGKRLSEIIEKNQSNEDGIICKNCGKPDVEDHSYNGKICISCGYINE
jgi:ribosomal protein L37E